MKYFVTVLFLMLLAPTSNGQISFSYQEAFAAFSQAATSQATSFSSTDVTGLNALIAKSGAGMSWDFGNRVYTQDAASSGTETILTYPGGAALADDADFMISTHVLQSVPNDPTKPTVYVFIKFDQNGYWIVGESQDSMGVKKKLAAYVPPQQQLQFPLTYTSSWQSTSDLHSPLLPSGASDTISIDAVADAYGTLTTPTIAHKQGGSSPMASGDALRVKTKNTTAIHISIGPITESIVTVNYTFQYYTKTGHSATIDADTNVNATGAHYSVQGINSVADNYSSTENLLNLYLSQNPASNTETKLFYTMKNDGNTQVSIMDALGREVHMLQNGFAPAGQNIIPIDPTKLSAGTYFLRVNADGMSATQKLIIQK
jgi:hypothetical protein